MADTYKFLEFLEKKENKPIPVSFLNMRHPTEETYELFRRYVLESYSNGQLRLQKGIFVDRLMRMQNIDLKKILKDLPLKSLFISGKVVRDFVDLIPFSSTLELLYISDYDSIPEFNDTLKSLTKLKHLVLIHTPESAYNFEIVNDLEALDVIPRVNKSINNNVKITINSKNIESLEIRGISVGNSSFFKKQDLKCTRFLLEGIGDLQEIPRSIECKDVRIINCPNIQKYPESIHSEHISIRVVDKEKGRKISLANYKAKEIVLKGVEEVTDIRGSTTSNFDLKDINYVSNVKAYFLNLRNVKAINNIHADTLFISNSPIKVIPDNVKFSALTLRNCSIEKLPSNLRTLRSLSLFETNINKLPENLSVIQNGLYIHKNTPITTLSNLKVSNLTIVNEHIKEIKDTLITNYMHIHSNSITALPENINGTIATIMSKSIQTLPKGMKVSTLVLKTPNVNELPSDLTVTTKLKISGGSIAKMTESEIRKIAPGITGKIVGLRKNITTPPK